MASPIQICLIFFAFIFIYLFLSKSQNERRGLSISGAFTIPGFPIVGNTFQIWYNPSRVFLNWANKYQISLFVIKLGNIPVIIVNSYTDVAALWKGHSSSLGSRPDLFTFHKVISAIQGFTVGTTPAGESFNRKKKSISTTLSKQYISCVSTCEILDRNSSYILAYFLHQIDQKTSTLNQDTTLEVSFVKFAQYYVLRSSLLLTYGYEIDPFRKEKRLANNVIETENQIIRLRSLFSNYQDYLPFFNWSIIRSHFDHDANHWRSRRDKYMDDFYQSFEKRLELNHVDTRNSIIARILSGSKAKPLKLLEIKSICLSMVSAGLDNVSFVLNYILGQLANPKRGVTIQDRLIRELLAACNQNVIQAWKDVTLHTDCGYACAIIEEALRHFTVLPLSLPRKTTKDILYKGVFIPAGTIMVMNAYHANHDPSIYEEPNSFQPERWLDESTCQIDKSVPPHFSFGAGSRMCSGDKLAFKEMYTMLCRTVLLFKIKPPKDKHMEMNLDPFEGNSCPYAASFEPKEFHVRLQLRQGPNMYELREYILS